MIQKIICTFLCLLLTVPSLPQTIMHPWSHKRVAYLGDSITDPRVKANKDKWWTYLQEWLGITSYVYAISGRQWNDIPRQAEQLLKEHGQDFDAILIFMGTNDFNSGVPVGEWYRESTEKVLAAVHAPKAMVERKMRQPDFNKDTYKGRINIGLKRVKELFPNKQIVLLTPIHRGFFMAGEKNIQPTEAYQNMCGEYFDKYVEAIKEAGNIWSVPVIDLNAASGLYPLLPEYLQFYHDAKTDQLHPNDSGYRRMALTLYYQLLTLPASLNSTPGLK